ncbi:hypothetical protein [Clostridium haemolyticum]|nr:hypothetical protein [Clostridium haemolyticum]
MNNFLLNNNRRLCEYKFQKVDEAMWVAAVLLTYNEYMKMNDKELNENYI